MNVTSTGPGGKVAPWQGLLMVKGLVPVTHAAPDPAPDPPLLHEARASKSVAQATNLLSDWFQPFITLVRVLCDCRRAEAERVPLVSRFVEVGILT